MQNNIQIFKNEEFGEIRIIHKDGQPWFVGKDVADMLGYSNSSKAVSKHVDEDDRLSEMIPTSQNGKLVSKTHIINESGLYSLILSSKLPTAKTFKRWVTSEVLPTIRQHGAYITDDTLNRMREDNAFTDELLGRLSALQPKAQYYDTVLQSENGIPTTAIAKDYGMSAVAFNKMLHKFGVQYRIGGCCWFLYSKYQNKGYTVTKTYLVNDKKISIQTCWTQRGRAFLYDLLKWYGVLPTAETIIEEAL